ncbi:MAG: helix-turn-helix transcriptional regulator [Minisyncoccia bacterium]
MLMREYIKNEVEALRLRTGVTQENLASNVDVSRQTIVALEKGHYTPSVLLAIKIASFFKTPVEKIFKISYEK